MNIKSFEDKYFDHDFHQGFKALFGSKAVLMIASGFLGIFLPIFLFNLFNGDIKLVVTYFGMASLIYIVAVPLGAMFLNSYGFRNALKTSVVWGVLFYIIFFFLDKTNAYYLIPLSLVTLILFRISYWIPYHVDFAKFSDNEDRGREISFFSATNNILASLVPILSGFLIAKFGFNPIFVIAIILYLSAGLFYLRLPRTQEKFEWTYLQSWKEFFAKKNRKVVLAFMSDGAEELVGAVVWPIFIFQLLDGNYFEVGYLSAFIITMTIVLQLMLGNVLDKTGKKRAFLKFGTMLYSFGWVIKMFIVTAFHIFVAGIYHNVAKIFSRTSFDVVTYDIAAERGHYVDEFTVIHEMAIHFGKFLASVVIVILSFYLPLQWTFLMAAAASLLMSALKSS